MLIKFAIRATYMIVVHWHFGQPGSWNEVVQLLLFNSSVESADLQSPIPPYCNGPILFIFPHLIAKSPFPHPFFSQNHGLENLLLCFCCCYGNAAASLVNTVPINHLSLIQTMPYLVLTDILKLLMGQWHP